jgi:dTMP kinase
MGKLLKLKSWTRQRSSGRFSAMVLKNFIVFEGLDGAGTTTQINLVSAFFSERLQRNIHVTQEPTASPIGKLLREYLSGRHKADPSTLAHLFAADRNEHVHGQDGIRDHLSRGEIVLSDRYFFSSIAYQQVPTQVDLPILLNQFPLPEILFYFDIDPAVSFGRLGNRSELEIFEKLPFQRQVAARYDALLTLYAPSDIKIFRIDASLPKEKVTEQILERLSAHFEGVHA